MPSKSKNKVTSTKTSKPAQQSASATPQQIPPNWPPLQPLVPAVDLSLHELLPNQILTISSLWTSTLCKIYVSFLSSQISLTTTPSIPKRGDAIRVNDRYHIQDPAFASTLWESTALKSLVLGLQRESNDALGLDLADPRVRQALWGGEPLGLNPNIRVYRYTAGQFFDRHYDDSNALSYPDPENPGRTVPARTTWTLLLYLTSPATGCIGGETVFYPEGGQVGGGKVGKKGRPAAAEPVVVGLEVGMGLLHRHGRECLLHEGREVTQGEKWILRSDLVVRR